MPLRHPRCPKSRKIRDQRAIWCKSTPLHRFLDPCDRFRRRNFARAYRRNISGACRKKNDWNPCHRGCERSKKAALRLSSAAKAPNRLIRPHPAASRSQRYWRPPGPPVRLIVAYTQTLRVVARARVGCWRVARRSPSKTGPAARRGRRECDRCRARESKLSAWTPFPYELDGRRHQKPRDFVERTPAHRAEHFRVYGRRAARDQNIVRRAIRRAQRPWTAARIYYAGPRSSWSNGNAIAGRKNRCDHRSTLWSRKVDRARRVHRLHERPKAVRGRLRLSAGGDNSGRPVDHECAAHDAVQGGFCSLRAQVLFAGAKLPCWASSHHKPL